MLNSFDPSVSDADLEAIGNTVRSKIQATSGFDTPNIYVNYDYGDESLADLYGASNLKRLFEVKARWDSGNVFGKGNPIPPQIKGANDFQADLIPAAPYILQDSIDEL